MPDSCEALVVGGGPAGSATALRLAALGHQVMLVDKARFPRDKCCSEYASPETLRELNLLGVLSTVDARNWTRLSGTAVTGARGARLHGRFADAGHAPFRSTGMALPRREFDAMLLAAAREAGVMVREATRLEAIGPAPDGTMHATVAGDAGRRIVQTRVVIGADGLGSRVARLARLRRHGALRRVAFVAHLSGVRDMGGHAELHVGERSYVGLNPLDALTTNVALVVRAEDAAAARGDATEFFWRQLDRFPLVATRVAAGTVVRAVLVSGPFDARSRRSTADGVALVGDAAEFFDPFTGEGIWTALAGARLLAGTLDPLLRATAPITDGSLAPYRRARRRRFAAKWMVERTIGHAMRWPALFDHAVGRIHRAGLGSVVIGITGDFVPASQLLRPRSLWRLALGENREQRSEIRDLNASARTSELRSRISGLRHG
jgi:flavin-dependent dehydrogenase